MTRSRVERWEWDQEAEYPSAEEEIEALEAAERRQAERNAGPDFCGVCLQVGCTRCDEDDRLHAFSDDRPSPTWSPGSAA